MPKVFHVDRKKPSTWQEALSEFIMFKKAQGRGERTIADYGYHLTRFFTKYPEAFDPAVIRQRVLDYLGESAGLSAATYNLRREYLKAFCAWCVREGILPENPLMDIPKRKDTGKIRHLPEDVLKKLLTLPNKNTFAGLRDYTYILLAVSTGARPGEILSLLPEDVDLRRLSITIKSKHSKTRQEAILPILPKVADALKKLIDARHPSWGEEVPVFCSYTGRPLSVLELEDRFEIYSKKLGVKVFPYMLRHTFAVMSLRGGANAFTVQAMLRHSHMNMTLRYVKLVESDVRGAMEKANPLNRIMPQQNRVRKIRGDK